MLIGGYLCLGITIAMMQSCFSYDGWIVGIVFRGGNYPSNHTDIDDLTKNIEFQVIAGDSSDLHVFSSIKNIDLFSKCYATTVCTKWQNSLDVSSFSMTFDRNFVFDSDTIEAGVDILGLKSIRTDIVIDKDNDDCKYIIYTINFSTELTNRLIFESGEYIVGFSCKTTDGQEFNKSRRAVFYRD